MQKISAKTMRKDIYDYKYIKHHSFSEKRHIRREKIIELADMYGEMFMADELDIKGKEKLFALYVNTISPSGKRELLQKLQQQVDFNIEQYLEHSALSFWQKLRYRNDSSGIYLSSKQMRKQIDFYIKAHKKLSHGWFDNHDLYVKSEEMRNFAQDYITSFNRGKIHIQPKDMETFYEYINVMAYPIYDGSPAQQALYKLDEIAAQMPTQTAPVQQTKTPKKSGPSGIAVFFNSVKQKISNLKLPKFSFPHFKRPQIKIKPLTRPKFNLSAHKEKLKAAAVTALFLMFSLGLKNGSNPNANKNSPKENKIEQKQKAVTTTATQSQKKNIDFKNAAQAIDKAENNSQQQTAADSNDIKYQKVLKNYYDETISSLTSSEIRDELYARIDHQLQKGIFSLPQNLTKERVAHSYLMYKLYGVKSSISSALEASEKLSDKAQAEFVKDVENAGDTGLGVKKIASQKTKKLSNHSIMSKKSVKQQKQHAKNLKELRQMRKAMSRAH